MPEPAGPSGSPPLDDPEDAKLFTLARSALARSRSPEAAAVRDGMARTYVAVAVSLPSLTLSALQLAVAQAVSSGADTLAAAVVVTAGDGPVDERALRDVAPDAPVHVRRP